MTRTLLCFGLLFCAIACAAQPPRNVLPAAPKSQFVEVQPGVKLEVLDWGGTGRPAVLLAGLGGTPRAFDNFAAALKSSFHVYGITRRGYGASSAPEPDEQNYGAERLGEDVVAVLNGLHLERPVLIGHSFAGEELSFIGNRYPERVAGLVYLDAGGRFALSRRDYGDMFLDVSEVRRLLTTVLAGIAEDSLDDQAPVTPEQQMQSIADILQVLPDIAKELEARQKSLAAARPESLDPAKVRRAQSLAGRIDLAVFTGQSRFTTLHCPALVIFPSPHRESPSLTGEALARAESRDSAYVESRATLFRAIPNVKVVLIPHATHNVFDSNESDVLREIEAFTALLP